MRSNTPVAPLGILPAEQVRAYGSDGAQLLTYLSWQVPDADGWITVSDSKIEQDTGLTYRAIRRAVRRLERAGVLEIQREARKTPRYRFLADSEDEALREYWARLATIYPKREGGHDLHEAYQIFRRLIRAGEDPNQILLAAEIYRLEQDNRARTPGQGTGSKYVKKLKNWLRDRDYRRYVSEGDSKRAVSASRADARPEPPPAPRPEPEPVPEPVPNAIPYTNGDAPLKGDPLPYRSPVDEFKRRVGLLPPEPEPVPVQGVQGAITPTPNAHANEQQSPETQAEEKNDLRDKIDGEEIDPEVEREIQREIQRMENALRLRELRLKLVHKYKMSE